MTIVVTGATGHLGRLVVEALLDRGVVPGQVVATGRRAEALAGLAARGVQARRADYDDPASLEAAFAGADELLFVSGSEVGKRMAQHRNVVQAAARAGVGHLVYTSAPHADASPLAVAPDHKATEELIAASGVPATILRNNWYSENYLGNVAQARATGEIVSNTAGGRVASAPRADYAAAAAAVLAGDGHRGDHVGKVYELAGDHAWDYDELATILADVTGRAVTHRAVSADEHRAELVAAGTPAGLVDFVVDTEAAIAAGALADASTGDLSRLIGRPTTPLRQTLAAG